MLDFKTLKKNLKKEVSGLRTIKLAILADSASQLIAQSIIGMGVESALNINVFEADFNQIDRQIFDIKSELYEFNPDVILIFESTHKLLQKYNNATQNERIDFAKSSISQIELKLNAIRSNITSKIIFCNYTEEDDMVFGQYANKIEFSFIFQLRKLNYLLQEMTLKNNDVYLCDLSTIQNNIGRQIFWSPVIYTNTEMVLSIDALPYFALSVVQIIKSFLGLIIKCVILDLDNTIWGGVIGDDGIENIQIGQLGIGKAFTEFQQWLKKLQQRGVIIAICSKNTEAIALEPFENHPDMVLRKSDISVIMANWENKADNIHKIQQILDIGFDSMVFIDDNPFERNLVRQNISTILVPELPEDPALYLDFLYGLNLFETVSYSNEDTQRTEQYQHQAERVVFQKTFTNEDDFLKSLQMISETKAFDLFTIPRIAQLSQRSNQFNLRTIRFTEAELKAIAISESYHTLSFTLEDKFGDNGLICAVILEKRNQDTLFIHTWFMSCRVLKRNMENYVLNNIVSIAKKNNYKYVLGEYLPTPKNQMVCNHYKSLEFEFKNGYWELDITNYKERENYISKKL